MSEKVDVGKITYLHKNKVLPVTDGDSNDSRRLKKSESASSTLDISTPRNLSVEKVIETAQTSRSASQFAIKQGKIRKDQFGTEITKGSKAHKVSFNEKKIETVHVVRSFKKYSGYYGRDIDHSCCCNIM